VDTKVFIDGEESEFVATVEGQLVTLLLNREQLNEIAGSEINLQITAKINADVEVETIENVANVQVNNEPDIDSNVVTVVPPVPEVPSIVKDVEGQGHINVNREEEYNYNIITTLPNEIEFYERFI